MKKDNIEEKIIKIFWTGGYDSTYRIVQLSRMPVTIKPYYISDDRKSEEYELNAIKKITKLLKNNPNTKAKFEKLQIIDKKNKRYNHEIEETYNKIRKNDFFGSQYNWLAVFALEHPGIEVSIHQDDKAIILINKYGKLKKVKDHVIGDYYIIDEEKTSEDIVKLFGNYNLPLANISKIDMKKYYIENGYKDIMDLTWFCYRPIKGKPCGACNPCNYTIEEGMKERFTKKALFRNKFRIIYKCLYKLEEIILKK